MKVRELKELLSDCEDDWEVYVEADHGQLPERLGGVCEGLYYPDENGKPPYYGEDIIWGSENFDEDDEPNCVNIWA